MPSFFLFCFLRYSFILGQAGLDHVTLLLPHSAEFQDDRHELPPLMRFQSYTASQLLNISWRLTQFQNASIWAPPHTTTGHRVQLTLHLSITGLSYLRVSSPRQGLLLWWEGGLAHVHRWRNDWLQLQLLSVPLRCSHSMVPLYQGLGLEALDAGTLRLWFREATGRTQFC